MQRYAYFLNLQAFRQLFFKYFLRLTEKHILNGAAACEEYALKEQKKHTLCVSAAPVGRIPKTHTPYPAMPRAEKQVGPSARIRPKHRLNTPDQPHAHLLNGHATCKEYVLRR